MGLIPQAVSLPRRDGKTGKNKKIGHLRLKFRLLDFFSLPGHPSRPDLSAEKGDITPQNLPEFRQIRRGIIEPEQTIDRNEGKGRITAPPAQSGADRDILLKADRNPAPDARLAENQFGGPINQVGCAARELLPV